MRGVDQSSGDTILEQCWDRMMDLEKGHRMTYFCLKYSKELSTAAMPCRHCKYGTESMKGKSKV
jgi:hypothetical protein